MPEPELTRRDRIAACARLEELAAEIAQIASWFDTSGQDADKASILLECAARDLRAGACIIKPADLGKPDWMGLESTSGPGPYPGHHVA